MRYGYQLLCTQIWVPQGDKKQNGAEAVVEEIMTEKLP